MIAPIVNTTGYAYDEGKPNNLPRLNLEVTFILDLVYGPWSEPEDLMKHIASHSYVDTVTFVEDANNPFEDLLECCGHIQDGSDRTVSISQDDATNTFIVCVGNQRYWGDSLQEALINARKDRD